MAKRKVRISFEQRLEYYVAVPGDFQSDKYWDFDGIASFWFQGEAEDYARYLSKKHPMNVFVFFSSRALGVPKMKSAWAHGKVIPVTQFQAGR